MTLRTPALLALLLTSALGGCSGSVSIGDQTLDQEKLTQDIRGDYEAQTDIDLPRLSCLGTDKEVGAKIDCSGRNARNVELQIDGEITAVDGSDIKYKWAVSRAVAPGKIFAEKLAAAISQKLQVNVTSVQCPPRVPIKQGTTLSCEVVAANGDRAVAKIEQTDADGGFKVLTLKKIAGGPSGTSGAAS